MDLIRNSLMSKIDQFVSEALQNTSTSTGAKLQIEARIVDDGDEACSQPPRRCVLGDISLEDLKHSPKPATAGDANHHLSKQRSLPFPEQYPAGEKFNSGASTQRFTLEARTPGNGDADEGENEAAQQLPRRKMVGGLCLGHSSGNSRNLTPPRTPTPTTTRQLESDERHFPKRRKLGKKGPAKLQRSTIDKLIEGIWEQIHKPRTLALGPELGVALQSIAERVGEGSGGTSTTSLDFGTVSRCCRQITCGSRTARALEVIIQAYWVESYEARLAALREERPDMRPYEHKKMVLSEACTLFAWSEKELRNRMAVWRGYREIKDAAGWSALVFSGQGIYRFCKYRLGFDHEAISKLRSIRVRAEVAADALQPQWRQLLSLVGASTQPLWHGHPHDWVVSKCKDPFPLATTYHQWDPHFSFTHLDESTLDTEKWGTHDPRRLSATPPYICPSCSKPQSTTAETNECSCFPTLFSPVPRSPSPVQVFQTSNGRNNGLIACCPFERGTAVGEFIGLITKGLVDVDVMQSQAGPDDEPYQIWQGHCGNFTRFINHSCRPNCQFQAFTWLGVQRIIVVSKGVKAGEEVTVDYSGRYWRRLDKLCLCGEAGCRYKSRGRRE